MCFEEWTGIGFSGSTRTLWRKGAGKRAWTGGSSPWNFNQRQLLARVTRSPYIRTFLETQRQNSILPSFSPLSRSFLPRARPGRANLIIVIVVRRGGNRQVLPRDARRLILSPKAPFSSIPAAAAVAAVASPLRENMQSQDCCFVLNDTIRFASSTMQSGNYAPSR